ncbi:hypothetical protein ACQEU3_46950 [Spirillospora sp. CA-253888]
MINGRAHVIGTQMQPDYTPPSLSTTPSLSEDPVINGHDHSAEPGPVFHQIHPARDSVHRATANAINWAAITTVMAALPCIVWLWKWAW